MLISLNIMNVYFIYFFFFLEAKKLKFVGQLRQFHNETHNFFI